MKNIFKNLFLLTITLVTTTSCVNDDDFEIPTIRNPFFSEDFQTATTNTDFDFTGWTNFARTRYMVVERKTYIVVTNGYAEFSALVQVLL